MTDSTAELANALERVLKTYEKYHDVRRTKVECDRPHKNGELLLAQAAILHEGSMQAARKVLSGISSAAPATAPKADAPKAEPVGEAGAMPGTAGFTIACFKAADVPVGTKLYVSPDPLAKVSLRHAEDDPNAWVLSVLEKQDRPAEFDRVGDFAYHLGRGEYEIAQGRTSGWLRFDQLTDKARAFWVARAFVRWMKRLYSRTQPSDRQAADSKRLDAIASEYWRLDSFSMPTGYGDADVGWRVLGYFEGSPAERVIAEVYNDSPRAALDAAMARLAAGTDHPVHQQGCAALGGTQACDCDAVVDGPGEVAIR